MPLEAEWCTSDSSTDEYCDAHARDHAVSKGGPSIQPQCEPARLGCGAYAAREPAQIRRRTAAYGSAFGDCG